MANENYGDLLAEKIRANADLSKLTGQKKSRKVMGSATRRPSTPYQWTGFARCKHDAKQHCIIQEKKEK